MNNVKNIKEIEHNLGQVQAMVMQDSCLCCKSFTSFTSFADDYFDEMEPRDVGFCYNPKGKYYFNEGAGAGVTCKYHKSA